MEMQELSVRVAPSEQVPLTTSLRNVAETHIFSTKLTSANLTHLNILLIQYKFSGKSRASDLASKNADF